MAHQAILDFACRLCVVITIAASGSLAAAEWSVMGHSGPEIRALNVDKASGTLAVLISQTDMPEASGQDGLWQVLMFEPENSEIAAEIRLNQSFRGHKPEILSANSSNEPCVATRDDKGGPNILCFDGKGLQREAHRLAGSVRAITGLVNVADSWILLDSSGVFRVQGDKPERLYSTDSDRLILAFSPLQRRECPMAVLTGYQASKAWQAQILCESAEGLSAVASADSDDTSIAGVPSGLYTSILRASEDDSVLWVGGPDSSNRTVTAACRMEYGQCELTGLSIEISVRPLTVGGRRLAMTSDTEVAALLSKNGDVCLAVFALDGRELSEKCLKPGWTDDGRIPAAVRTVGAELISSGDLIWALVYRIGIMTEDRDEYVKSGNFYEIAASAFRIKNGRVLAR